MYSTSSDTCYGTRNSCPSNSINTCYHYEDVTITCSKFLYLLLTIYLLMFIHCF